MNSLAEQFGIQTVDKALANIQGALEQMRHAPVTLPAQATDTSWDTGERSFEMLEMAALLEQCGERELNGDDVRRMREALGFSRNDLSNFLGYASVNIELWEIGRNPVPKTIRMLLRLLILSRAG